MDHAARPSPGLNAQRDRHAQKRRPRDREVFPLDAPAQDSSAGGLDPAASQTSPSQHVARDEEAERVQEGLDSIAEPQHREILTLRFFQELPLTEVAERMRLSYDKARTLFAAALAALEAQLERPHGR